MSIASLSTLAATLETLPDPRSKQGVPHPYHGMLALVLLGLIAQLPTVAAHIIEYGDAGQNDNGTFSKNPSIQTQNAARRR
jgi:hypothetical protein